MITDLRGCFPAGQPWTGHCKSSPQVGLLPSTFSSPYPACFQWPHLFLECKPTFLGALQPS